MIYDAAIIGADADGLAAAITLARSGLRVIVQERGEVAGGRCITREFHPGFHASPFCDELAPIPAEIFWSLGLARHGVVFMPSPASTGLWPDLSRRFRPGTVHACADGLAKAALARAQADITPPARAWFSRRREEVWPGDIWASESLSGVVASDFPNEDAAALALSVSLAGRVAQPDLAGSALHLLAPGTGGSGLAVGGLQGFTNSLLAAARAVGVEIICGLEAADITHRRGRVSGLRLADGSEIRARAVISALDLKCTFLSLFAWSDLPSEIANRVGSFRMTGNTARLLFALDSLPDAPGFADSSLFAGPIHVAPHTKMFGHAYAAWRSGVVADRLPMMLRFVSVTDPRACPTGAATMTVTVGGVPARLFDGSWTHERREALREQVLTAVEHVLPGTTSRVRACTLLTPADIEEVVGCTDGDLWGGEIAADQMLGIRPWLDCAAPRTPVAGLYMAGPSTDAGVLATCASGVFAARALMFDLKTGFLK